MCAVCHGAHGEGYAADHAPSLTRRDFLSSVDDAYLRTRDPRWPRRHHHVGVVELRGGPLANDDVGARHRVPALVERPPAGHARRPAPTAATRARRRLLRPRVRGLPRRARRRRHLRRHRRLRSPARGERRLSPPGHPRRAPRHADAGLRGRRSATTASTTSSPLLRELAEDRRRAARKPPAKLPPLPLGPVPAQPARPGARGLHSRRPQTTKLDVVKAQLDAARAWRCSMRAPRRTTSSEHIAGAVSVPFYDPETVLRAAPEGRLARLLLLLPARRVGPARAEARRERLHEGHRARRGPARLEGEGSTRPHSGFEP